MNVFRSFENELGNRIQVTVGGDTGGIHINIERPTSTASNMLTRREAVEVHAALGKVLRMQAKAGHDKPKQS